MLKQFWKCSRKMSRHFERVCFHFKILNAVPSCSLYAKKESYKHPKWSSWDFADEFPLHSRVQRGLHPQNESELSSLWFVLMCEVTSQSLFELNSLIIGLVQSTVWCCTRSWLFPRETTAQLEINWVDRYMVTLRKNRTQKGNKCGWDKWSSARCRHLENSCFNICPWWMLKTLTAHENHAFA